MMKRVVTSLVLLIALSLMATTADARGRTIRSSRYRMVPANAVWYQPAWHRSPVMVARPMPSPVFVSSPTWHPARYYYAPWGVRSRPGVSIQFGF